MTKLYVVSLAEHEPKYFKTKQEAQEYCIRLLVQDMERKLYEDSNQAYAVAVYLTSGIKQLYRTNQIDDYLWLDEEEFSTCEEEF